MKSVKLITLLALVFFVQTSWASSKFYTFEPENQEDTIIITVGKDSKIVMYVRPEDREKIRKLDWNALMQKATQHLDTATRANKNISLTEDGIRYEILDGKPQYKQEVAAADTTENLHQKFKWKSRKGMSWNVNIGGNKSGYNPNRLYWKWNLDLGLNNYVHVQNAPANTDYGLDPINSRYVAVQTSLLKPVSPNFAISWGLEYCWYNFRFEKGVRIDEGREGVLFTPETTLDVQKSKLVVMYLSLPVMLKFRITNIQLGIGGQVGYRMGSYSRFDFINAQGGEITDRKSSSYNLNDFRYGLRGELGFSKKMRWSGTKLFFNYDLNHLFKGSQSPELQAFSFGIRL